MSVVIKEVLTKKDLKKWVRFPNLLYKGNPYFVPFLEIDEINTFTKGKNAAYDFCDTKLFLAYKDGKIVGRIAGLVNHAYNKKWNKNAIRFTRFDFVDDFEVSNALFNKVVEWGKEEGLTEIMGPIGFTDMDHEGMLVEGYEELNMSITFYNYPYYLTHMERLGLNKDIDWVEYQLNIPESVDDRFVKITNRLMERNGYKLVTYKTKKEIREDAFIAFKVIDEAFAKLYGTVPLTDNVINEAIDNNIDVMNLKYICSVKDKNNELIAFAVLVPSIARALKKSNGKLFPLGIFRMLKALNGKNDVLEMFFIAVKEEHQNKGVPAIIINYVLQTCIDNGIKYCETGPELETNEAVQSMWKTFDVRRHKRRRCFIKGI